MLYDTGKRRTFFAAFLLCVMPIAADSPFGGWAISEATFNYIHSILNPGATILELGSGLGTGLLSKSYTMYSIEHDKRFVNMYKSTYIYAPIVNGWYDAQVLMKQLPEHYDLILVDGPTGKIGRYGFFMYLHLFNTNVPIIIDDTDRPAEHQLLCDVAACLGRSYEIIEGGGKSFGVILPS